jgi:hypothetical protein
MSIVPATLPSAFTSEYYRHVALTISGSTHTLYLDGSVVAVNPNGGNMLTYSSAIQNMYIGCAGDLSYGFTGIIDDFKVWNRALPLADISAIYFANAVIKLNRIIYFTYQTQTLTNLGTSSTATVTGTTTLGSLNIRTSGNYSFAVYRVPFTGGNSVSIGNFGNLKNFTILWWMWPFGANDTMFVAQQGNTRIFTPNFEAYNTNTILYDLNGGGITYSSANNTNMSANTWYHYAISISYTNGNTFYTLNSYQNGVNTLVNQNRNFFSGSTSSTYTGLDNLAAVNAGTMDMYKFMVYDSVLSQSQIQSIYDQK